MKNSILSVFAPLFIILLGITLWTSPARADVYRNFAQLELNNKPNVDYQIESEDRGSSISVIAIHGGNIEPETNQIAKAVADQGGYDFYTFEGLEPNSSSLHITSANFDEPTGRSLVSKTTKTLSIHGCVGNTPVTNLGGLDIALGQEVKASLQAAGFKVIPAPCRLGGGDPRNIANCNISTKGVQLELTKALRQQLANNPTEFNSYVAALVTALTQDAHATSTITPDQEQPGTSYGQ